MKFTETTLSGLYLIQASVFEDNRGWFFRSFDAELFATIGHSSAWVQCNHSYTAKAGTVRGMHFQYPPHAEIKLIRCVAGKVFDVAIDLRKNSKTFLHWFGTELSAENKQSIYIPAGFAHGFQALSDDAELIYMHSQSYHKESESGIHHADPTIAIQWPLPIGIVSDRDQQFSLIHNDFTGI